MKYKKFTYLQKNSKLLVTQDFISICIIMEYQKITNLICNMLDKVSKFITKKRLKFIINLVMQIIDTNQVNK